MYVLAKNIHLIAVTLSIILFVVRFILLTMNKPLGNHKVLRILPHVTYTVLILSAGWLCSILHIYPFATAWVTFKLLGLIGFVLSALWATQWSKNTPSKWLGFALALVFIFLTISVAFSKQPLF